MTSTATVPVPAGLRDTIILREARAWLHDRMLDGETCPLCGQFAKIYRRKIHSTIARALVDLYRLGEEDKDYWVHVPTAISPACEVGKARYWELVEEARGNRPDGGRPGFWRLTDLGVMFVRGMATVPKYAHIFDSKCLWLDGNNVDISQALGDQFALNDLLAGR